MAKQVEIKFTIGRDSSEILTKTIDMPDNSRLSYDAYTKTLALYQGEQTDLLAVYTNVVRVETVADAKS